MTKLPRVKGTELIAALRKAGFEVMRVKEVITTCNTPTDGALLFPFTVERLSALG